MDEKPPKWWQWVNLLSIDAPLVAVGWLWLLSKSWRVQYQWWQVYVILAGVVWCLYVLDRLIDCRRRDRSYWGARHYFHQKHRVGFICGLGVVGLASIGLVLFGMPRGIVSYGLGAIFLTGCYGFLVVRPQEWTKVFFVMIGVMALGMMAQSFSGIVSVSLGEVIFLVACCLLFPLLKMTNKEPVPLFKNILGGVTFAYGTSLGAHFFLPSVGVFEMISSREMVGFALLCVLNITAIDIWELGEDDSEMAQRYRAGLALALAGAGLYGLLGMLTGDSFTKPLSSSIFIAAGSLYLLNRTRRRFSLEALRVLADVALLLPIPVLFLQ